MAQLGNAVDEWAAAADVEQGAQAALHVVQQVVLRIAVAAVAAAAAAAVAAGMMVVIVEMPTTTDYGSRTGAHRGCGGDGEHGCEGKCTRGDRRVRNA